MALMATWPMAMRTPIEAPGVSLNTTAKQWTEAGNRGWTGLDVNMEQTFWTLAFALAC